VISLPGPVIRAVKLVETHERFIEVGSIDELLLAVAYAAQFLRPCADARARQEADE